MVCKRHSRRCGKWQACSVCAAVCRQQCVARVVQCGAGVVWQVACAHVVCVRGPARTMQRNARCAKTGDERPSRRSVSEWGRAACSERKGNEMKVRARAQKEARRKAGAGSRRGVVGWWG